MKILHILATPRAEGTPNLVLDWLGLPGYEQEVFVLQRTPPDLTEELRSRAKWYGEDDLFRGRGWRKFLRMTLSARRICRERRPELVVCWISGFAQWVAIGARWALGRKPTLLMYNGNPPVRDTRGDWLARFVLLPFWLLGGRSACCSDYVRDLYRTVPGLPSSLFSTVYNCVRADEICYRANAARLSSKSNERPPTGLMVATLEPHKDHATLLHAMPTVLTKYPAFQLLLAGDGTLRDYLEALAGELNLGPNVRFLGSRRDVPELLAQADLFIFSTTKQEGLGSVLLEALAVGLPVIASDCPACREALADGQHGTLVKPGDPVALAAAILQHFEGRHSRVADAGITYASGFTPQRMLQEYLKLAGLDR